MRKSKLYFFLRDEETKKDLKKLEVFLIIMAWVIAFIVLFNLLPYLLKIINK